MQFLTPFFLAGLAAMAVPLWFHLIRKEQSTHVPFSSLRYVPPRELELVRRHRLRQWPLFLLRLLLVVLAVLALARPYSKNFSRGWASSASLARVVLVDNSLSMRAAGRWKTAQEAAEREIASAPPGSEITLALVSDRVDVLSEPGEPAGRLVAKLKQSPATYRATRLDQGIQVAGDMLKQSRMGTREIVLVSDFQKNGLHLSSWNIPEGVGLRTFAVPPAPSNLSIEDVQVPVLFENTQPADIVVRVQNRGAGEANDIPVELRVQDQAVETKRVNIGPKSSALVPFRAPDLKGEAIMRLAAYLDGNDSLPEDNWFFFSMRRLHRIPIVLSAAGPALLFLKEAINSSNAAWELNSGLNAESLRKARVLVLHDPEEIPAYVTPWVQDGGGLLLFWGARAGEGLKSPLLPVTPQGNRIVRREREEALRLAEIQWQHPVFQIFADQQKRYFSGIQFYGYSAAAVLPEGKVLARFNLESPALVEKNLGRGRVLWFASTASNDWNDFVLRPAFVPFVQQLTGYLSGAQNQSGLLRVGERLDLTAWGGAEAVAIDPGGSRLTIPRDPPLLDLDRPGIYELRYNRQSDYVSVNVPASESNLETEAVQEIQAHAGRARSAAAELSAIAMENRQSWWRIFLAAAALLALGEWLLADLYYGAASAPARFPGTR
ncbi:MAG: BatA domain-containing protein [Acidobacteria bacterium]|nr:BatA domain-containing protein [Acidobacteriota bacterium]